MQIHIDLFNGINNINTIKKYFIEELSQKLEKKYLNISIFIFDTLDNQVSKITEVEGNDWLVQRLYFFSEYSNVTVVDALKVHGIISRDIFDSRFNVIYKELQKREIFENYFFTFWINKLDTQASIFQYVTMVKKNIVKLYDENIQVEEKVNKLLKIIEQYRKK